MLVARVEALKTDRLCVMVRVYQESCHPRGEGSSPRPAGQALLARPAPAGSAAV